MSEFEIYKEHAEQHARNLHSAIEDLYRQKKETAAERDRLKDWKESAMQVLATWDKVCDSIQNRNDIKVGESISLKAIKLIQERDRLKEEVALMDLDITGLNDQVAKLKEENERLKCEWIDSDNIKNKNYSELQSINRDLVEACQWALTQFKKLSEDGKYPEHLLAENGGNGFMPLVKALKNSTL